jgi:hypothetical protein
VNDLALVERVIELRASPDTLDDDGSPPVASAAAVAGYRAARPRRPVMAG